MSLTLQFKTANYIVPKPLILTLGAVVRPTEPPPNTIRPMLSLFKTSLTTRVDAQKTFKFANKQALLTQGLHMAWQPYSKLNINFDVDFNHVEQTNSNKPKLVFSRALDAATQFLSLYKEGDYVSQFKHTVFNHAKLLSKAQKTGYAVPHLYTTGFATVFDHAELIRAINKHNFNHSEQLTNNGQITWGEVPYQHNCYPLYISPNTVTFEFWDRRLPSGFVFDGQNNKKVCKSQGAYFLPVRAFALNKPVITTVYRRSTHIVQHSIACFRDSDNLPIHITSFSMSTSRDQWGWSFALQCASKGEALKLSHVNGEPVDIRIEINGEVLKGIAEGIGRTSSFGSKKYSVSGRCIAARLHEPFETKTTYSNASARTIAQLFEEVLTGTGWTYTFDATDYLVPAGALNLTNATKMDVISSIAASMGCIVIAHTDIKDIQILPRNKAPYWVLNTATEDHQLNDSVIINSSENPANTALHNAVFVRGEQQGVSAKVKRQGTAGDKLAPDIVDPLITHIDAARQRATAELAEAGRGAMVSFTTTVMEGLPLVKPAALIAVDYDGEQYKMIVDSVALRADVSNDGKKTVRQTITGYRSYE